MNIQKHSAVALRRMLGLESVSFSGPARLYQ